MTDKVVEFPHRPRDGSDMRHWSDDSLARCITSGATRKLRMEAAAESRRRNNDERVVALKDRRPGG